MSEALRNTKIIYDAFVKISNSGSKTVRPGDIVEYMRERNDPVGIWRVMGELNNLHQLGLVRFDEEHAIWHLAQTSWQPKRSQDA